MTDDDRAEQAFRDAFATRADAFEPEVLSREPVPRHRPTWPAALLAVAAVLILAVGTVMWRSTGSDHRTTAAAAVSPPAGWHWESHKDVEVAVPDSWGYAPAPDESWCANYDDSSHQSLPRPGYVDTGTPNGGGPSIGCMGAVPGSLMVTHLSFADFGDPPADTVVGGFITIGRDVGGTRLVVVTDATERDLADRILATAHVVEHDQNGCPVSSPLQGTVRVRPSPPFDVSTLTEVDSIAVCQYDVKTIDEPGLIASRLLVGAPAQAELEALQSAPSGGGPNRGTGCDPQDPGLTAVMLRLTSGDATNEMYGYYEGCAGNGFDDGTSVRELTVEDCSRLWDERMYPKMGFGTAFDRCTPPRP
jgi:hypothetical protein